MTESLYFRKGLHRILILVLTFGINPSPVQGLKLGHEAVIKAQEHGVILES
jgi:hypothetical protein